MRAPAGATTLQLVCCRRHSQAYDAVDIVSLPTSVADMAGGVRSVSGGGRHSAVVLRKVPYAKRCSDWVSDFVSMPQGDFIVASGAQHG